MGLIRPIDSALFVHEGKDVSALRLSVVIEGERDAVGGFLPASPPGGDPGSRASR